MDDELDLLRKEINAVDEQIKDLFLKRLEIASRIGKYKAENGLPIFDPEREQRIRAAIKEDPDILIRKFYLPVNEALMQASKAYQEDLSNSDVIYEETKRIAYFGEGHSNTYISLTRMLLQSGYKPINEESFYKDQEEIVLVSTKDIADMKRKLLEGEVDMAFLPYVNSNAGVVIDCYNLMKEIRFRTLRTYADDIVLYLYVPKEDASRFRTLGDLCSIETIYSNVQALNQCSDFVNKNMPYATFRKASSTTQSIEMMLKDKKYLSACFANADAKADPRIVCLTDQTTSNNNGTKTKYLLIESINKESPLGEKKENLDDYFIGYYLYISRRKKTKAHSVFSKNYRAVEIFRDNEGFLSMQIYSFGNVTTPISYSRNATTYIDARTKEVCLMYEYEPVDKSTNVEGVAILRAKEENLRRYTKRIRGEYIGKDNGKMGKLEYRRISKEEFELFTETEVD